MGDQTKIEWCDATWSPMSGCTPVSESCEHCFARGFHDRGWIETFEPHWVGDEQVPGEKYTRLEIPLHWKKPRRIFVCSMSDLFHEAYEYQTISRVFDIMHQATWHTFMVLTKRPQRMAEWWSVDGRGLWGGDPLPNVWIGVTAENQQRADERISVLLDTPAAVRFVSIEPMLGPVDLREWLPCMEYTTPCGEDCHHPWVCGGLEALDWVIVGGETGAGARLMQTQWALDVWEQCDRAGVPFFFKRFGDNHPSARGRVTHEPAILQMMATREFPAVT